MSSFKNGLVMFVIIMLVWILLNNNIDPLILGVGAIISLLISVLLCSRCDLFREMKMTPKALFYTIGYLFVFIVELVRSNLDVTRRVLSPKLPINPGIVEVRTTLKSPFARMLLANSITLTPGTLTVEVKDESFFIHWIDVRGKDIESASTAIVKKFEKYLEVIYG